jgi:hypothetical protein
MRENRWGRVDDGTEFLRSQPVCAPRHVSNFGRRLTHSRYRALNFGGEAFVLEKEERMACDVDTGAVFKRPVHCFSCDQAFYFTLRKIAEAEKLACPLCGSDINLTDEAYGFVVTSVKETIALIDQFAASSAN